jgi:hypothetical protein
MALHDKFNIILDINSKNPTTELIDASQINNFIENYLESETYIIHPDYIHQLIWHNKILDCDKLIDTNMKKHLKQIKTNITNFIKKGDFDISFGLNKLIKSYHEEIKYLNTLFNSNNYQQYESLFQNNILSDPFLLSYLENEFSTLDINKKEEIKTLIYNIKKLYVNTNENYIWFLKFIGTTLRLTIPEINLTIPNKQSCEFMMLINYISEINSYYSFLGWEKKNITSSLNDILYDKFMELLNIEDFLQLHTLLKSKWYEINKLIANDSVNKKIKVEFSIILSKYVKKIKKYSQEEIYNLLNLVLFTNKIGLVESYILNIFHSPIILENIIILINSNIISNIEFIINMIPFFSNIKEKDVFICEYQKHLIRRILSHDTLIENERTIVNMMIPVFGEKHIKKLSKIINDYQNSLLDYHNYNSINQQKLEVITTSYSNWDINWSNGFVNSYTSSSQLGNYIETYNKFYQKRYKDKRKLLWLPQYGEIEIEYSGIKITLLPIQLMVLELFENKESHDEKFILNQPFFSNYSEQYKNDILKTFESSGILVHSNNNYVLTTNILKTNLINLIGSPLNSISVYNDLALTRKYITSTCINSWLKKTSLTYEQLFTQLCKDIVLFTLTRELLTETLNWMVENDYIRLENNMYNKIYY